MRKWGLAAAVAAMMASGLSIAWRPPEAGRQHDSSYVVASAEESRSVAQARVPVSVRSDGRASSPGSLPLLFVGSLLLGLGAAVRRTS